jgi:hypothetical protein
MSKLPIIVFSFVVIGCMLITWMEIMAKSLR